MEQVLSSHWLSAVIIGYNCNRSVNKFNHPIQNPLLLVTQTPHMWQYVGGFTCFQPPWLWKCGFWNVICLYAWMCTLSLLNGWMDFIHILYLRGHPLYISAVNMNILVPKKQNDSFLKKQNNFDQTIIIYGNHLPKWNWIYWTFRKVIVHTLRGPSGK
jgi:hypothetical protein